MRKLNVYDKYLVALVVFLAITYPLILYFFPVVTDSTVPTLVNGITTSMSIILALGGAVIGIVFRHDIEKDDARAKRTYIYILGLFLIILLYPWGSYLFLAQGINGYVFGTNAYGFALKYSLCGYLVALFAIMIVYVITARKWHLEEEKQPESGRSNSEESKTEEKSKNVNVFVNVNNQ